MDKNNVILYSYFRSSSAYRVRLALNLKQIPYQYRAVHLLKNGGEQTHEEFKKLNPQGQIPCLIHQGITLSQSMAILFYLDEMKNDQPLFPIPHRHHIIQACEIINSGTQPLQNLSVLQELGVQFKATQADKDQWSQKWIRLGLQAFETLIKPFSGSYCFGNQATAADCYLIPQIYNAHRFKVDLNEFPVLKKIDEYCCQQLEFIRAAPIHQPDAPEDFKEN